MGRITYRTPLPATPAEAFAWHARPGAFERLSPPWNPPRVVGGAGGIEDGATVKLRMKAGPLPVRWVAEHHDYQPPHSFSDRQVKGPFARWEHRHGFEVHETGCLLEDRIDLTPPGPGFAHALLESRISRELDRVFAYRHHITRSDLAAHGRWPHKLAVAVSGTNGLIGSQLTHYLTTGGHMVRPIVRGNAGPGQVGWDTRDRRVDADELAGCDAVVHLAGEPIHGRWTAGKRKRILESRVQGAAAIAEAVAAASPRPRVLVCASAVGFYGVDRGRSWIDETSAPGDGFLADVVRQWEAAAAPAVEAGVRVVFLRLGMVLDPRGGALGKMLPLFKLGLAGRLGDGQQHWSWIALDDVLDAILHVIHDGRARGPINLVAPEPVTQQVFTQTLYRVLGRPVGPPAPRAALRLALGAMTDALLLGSLRVSPAELQFLEHRFRYPSLEPALRHMLGR